jgi:hypothetical protein
MSIINRIFGKHVKLSINENENEIALTESGNEKVITFNNIVYSKLKKVVYLLMDIGTIFYHYQTTLIKSI